MNTPTPLDLATRLSGAPKRSQRTHTPRRPSEAPRAPLTTSVADVLNEAIAEALDRLVEARKAAGR